MEFSERLKWSLRRADRVASRLNRTEVGVAELALAILDTTGVACHVLRKMGMDARAFRSHIAAHFNVEESLLKDSWLARMKGLCRRQCKSRPETALSREVHETLSSAQREARGLCHNYVGTEHVLLALAKKSAIVSLFRAAGAAYSDVKKKTREVLG